MMMKTKDSDDEDLGIHSDSRKNLTTTTTELKNTPVSTRPSSQSKSRPKSSTVYKSYETNNTMGYGTNSNRKKK